MTHLIKTLLVSSIILIILFVIYSFFFINKTLPNTYFGNLSVSGKNEDQVDKIITNYIDNYTKQMINISCGSKNVEVSLADLGVNYDAGSSVSKVYQNPKKVNFGQFIKNYLSALVFRTYVNPSYDLNYSQLNNKLDALLSPYEKAPRDSTIIFDAHEPKISKSSNGIVVDRIKIIKDIITNLEGLSSERIIASYINSQSSIKESQAEQALEKVKALNNQNIILYYEQEKWPVSSDVLLNLLEFSPSDQDINGYLTLEIGGSKISIKDIDISDKTQPILQVRLNNEKISLLISDIASYIDKQTADATIEFDGQKVTSFTPASDGQQLNQTLAKNLILEKISVDNLHPEKNISILLPVEVTRAKIANKEINSLGVRELIGTGVSYFAGSIPNRKFNIELGAKLISGTLIAPGETFSFNKLVGPVSREQGFKQAYVINKGRTVLDDGGGICQVSTTVFRAVLNSGLPIVKRTAHAYRVGYYEQKGFKPGFDATIFSPSVDLQFKNDTANHILVQAKVDTANAKLQVDIYGTSDGRKVEISNAVVSNITPAPPPLYQDDPTLPKGTVKQVDFEAQGATSVFSRKVYKGDQVIIDETIRSNFRPWQAVYLVGTGG